MDQTSQPSHQEVASLDHEDLLYEAQQALISHDTPAAINLYTRALDSTEPNVRSAAALSLGKLYSSSPSPTSSPLPTNTSSPPAQPSVALDGSNGKKRGSAAKARDVEGMNKAGRCFLVGLAWDLERVEEVLKAEGEVGGKGKGKARDAGREQDPELLKSLESAHELSSYLLSLYRRNFLLPSDPASPCPIDTLPSLLSNEGKEEDASVWNLGKKLAERALYLPWLLEEVDAKDGSSEFATSKIGILIHLHYLLALTSSHSATPDVTLSNFIAITKLGQLLPPSSSTSQEIQSLVTSASKRINILQSKVARSPGRLDISSHLQLYSNNKDPSGDPRVIDTPLVSPGRLKRDSGSAAESRSTSASGTPRTTILHAPFSLDLL